MFSCINNIPQRAVRFSEFELNEGIVLHSTWRTKGVHVLLRRLLRHYRLRKQKVVSREDVKSKKKWYSAERNATRIYLYDQFNRWQDLKEELSLKMDKELAAVLLDNYTNQKGCCFR